MLSKSVHLGKSYFISCWLFIIIIHVHVHVYLRIGLKVPPAMKKRGRTKGHELTTIGLPAKKSPKDSGGPCAFSHMHTSEKVKGRFVCVAMHTLEVFSLRYPTINV